MVSASRIRRAVSSPESTPRMNGSGIVPPPRGGCSSLHVMARPPVSVFHAARTSSHPAGGAAEGNERVETGRANSDKNSNKRKASPVPEGGEGPSAYVVRTRRDNSFPPVHRKSMPKY